jgi:hypothetical protein
MELIIFFCLGTSAPTAAEIWRTTSQQEKNNPKIFDEVQDWHHASLRKTYNLEAEHVFVVSMESLLYSSCLLYPTGRFSMSLLNLQLSQFSQKKFWDILIFFLPLPIRNMVFILMECNTPCNQMSQL